jgi:ClpP class serine protease
LRALLRAVPAKPEEPADFAAARERWNAASARRRELVDKLGGAKAALALLDREEGAPALGPRLTEAAERFLGSRVLSARQLRREIEAAEDALDAAAPGHGREAAAWREAQSAEAARRLRDLAPRHRAAVKRIAGLVEQLSAAVEAERAVRAELSEVGGTGALPDASHEFGSLNEYGSTLSSWNRRVLAVGALDR